MPPRCQRYAPHTGLIFVFFAPFLVLQEAPVDVQAHTTPESRQALRQYLRQRRLTTSIHQTITVQALNDLEEALRLLRGLSEEPEWWKEPVASFLAQRLPPAPVSKGTPLPGMRKVR